MSANQAWEEWVKRFKAFIEHEAKAQGWIDQASHLHPNKFKDIGERVSEWVKRNPAPPNPHQRPKVPVHTPPPHAPLSPQRAEQLDQGMQRIRYLRNLRKGPPGRSSLGVIALLGGMTAGGFALALKLGVVAVKWYVEEKAWEAAERNFINPVFEAASYARMPATKSQLRYRYMQYCDFKVGSVANYGITPQLMSEADFCWMEYGVDMSVLAP